MPSRVIVNVWALYGVIGSPRWFNILNFFLPVRLPLFESDPLNAGVNLIGVDLTSEVLAASNATEPTPSSITVDWVDIICWVICFLVLSIVILFLFSSQSCKTLILLVLVFPVIELFPVDSMITSPNNWNPAGWVVSLINCLQTLIGVCDFIR